MVSRCSTPYRGISHDCWFGVRCSVHGSWISIFGCQGVLESSHWKAIQQRLAGLFLGLKRAGQTMAFSLDDKLVVAITSRALFDLDEAHEVFVKEDLKAYRKYQMEREDHQLGLGTGFPLVRALLNINNQANEHLVEVVLLSRNDADSGLRIWKSIDGADLDITRSAFTDGTETHDYLPAFSCDLFLSAERPDVVSAISAGCAVGLIYPEPERTIKDRNQVRIAFDGDAVLFSGESEAIFQKEGIGEFQKHELENEDIPLAPGPFKAFLEALSLIQAKFPEDKSPIRIALITSRNAPANRRQIKTLRAWGLRIDESFFLGGLEKAKILGIYRPHIFLMINLTTSPLLLQQLPPQKCRLVLTKSKNNAPSLPIP
jgi:5'-nucleotidase